MVYLMGQRDELFHKFSPLLLEAFLMVTLEEINILRSKAHLPLLTTSYILERVSTILAALPDYDWM